jgi:hypothetical protein
VARNKTAVKKFIVTLSDQERGALTALIHTGKHPAQKLLKARILLKADASDAGEGWSDSQIAAALESSVDTVARTRGWWKRGVVVDKLGLDRAHDGSRVERFVVRQRAGVERRGRSIINGGIKLINLRKNGWQGGIPFVQGKIAFEKYSPID